MSTLFCSKHNIGSSTVVVEHGMAPVTHIRHAGQCGRARVGSQHILQHTIAVLVHLQNTCVLMNVHLGSTNPPHTTHVAFTSNLHQIAHIAKMDRFVVTPITICGSTVTTQSPMGHGNPGNAMIAYLHEVGKSFAKVCRRHLELHDQSFGLIV